MEMIRPLEAGQFDDADDDKTTAKPALVSVYNSPQGDDGDMPSLTEDFSDSLVFDSVGGESGNISGSEGSDDLDDDDDDDFDWDITSGMSGSGDLTKRYNASVSHTPQPNSQARGMSKKSSIKYQPNDKAFSKFSQKINVEKYAGPTMSSSASSKLIENSKKADADRYRSRDKADRATVEQVMDPRTRMILFKLISRGVISEINGCISTGKEANVYHATSKDGKDRAVKVYKTSILVFKDRDKYVSGEFRFRHGYCKHNPRKMVRTWAEKEMRNLMRIHQSHILCPEPVILRSHVLVMDFIGTEGWPAPLLKDVDISESKSRELYLDCIQMMRTLYHECRLVHADLSEYNMLYHEGKLYVIDVSQSVEHDHPCALEFLRKDCTNINDYFRKNGVSTMTVRELFDYITDPSITTDNADDYLDKIMEVTSHRTIDDITEQEKIDEEVFKHSFIPRTLDDVVDIERDLKRAQKGQMGDILYHTVTGMKQNLTGTQEAPALLEASSGGGEGDDEDSKSEAWSVSDSGGEDDSEEENSDNSKTNNTRIRGESPNTRRERKKVVKDAQREKRKDKMPKHVKKRKEKTSKTGKGKK
ncbi:serine/threonine-protein kinase RIO1-like [Lineus longissimus]|uniref:serine/threonine-protein kinase RIO1-like n=1 Tax=Lineus longissimus TaxID=88925 RepID=UPI002B4F5682